MAVPKISLPEVHVLDNELSNPDKAMPSLVTGASDVAGHPSPALKLQSTLTNAFEVKGIVEAALESDVHVEKIDFRWTMLGLIAFCGLAWAAIFALI